MAFWSFVEVVFPQKQLDFPCVFPILWDRSICSRFSESAQEAFDFMPSPMRMFAFVKPHLKPYFYILSFGCGGVKYLGYTCCWVWVIDKVSILLNKKRFLLNNVSFSLQNWMWRAAMLFCSAFVDGSEQKTSVLLVIWRRALPCALSPCSPD